MVACYFVELGRSIGTICIASITGIVVFAAFECESAFYSFLFLAGCEELCNAWNPAYK
jgi:hypothetical protein